MGAEGLSEFGHPDRTARHDVELAISEKTVALAHLHSYHNTPRDLPFSTMRDIATEAKLPLIVDCAAILPPRDNLHRFVDEGADLVIFSGGKAIRAPNNTGIVLGGGRFGRTLIELMRMQSFPGYGIGRPFKVNKELIVGLVTALEIFLSEDENAEYVERLCLAEKIATALKTISTLSIHVVRNDGRDYEHPVAPKVPRVRLEWDASAVGFDASKLDTMMAAGDPPIKLRPPKMTQASVTNSNSVRLVDTFFLRAGEPEIVIDRIRQAFGGTGSQY